MGKPYGRLSPDRRVLGLVSNNNNNIYSPTDNLHLLTNVASELADSAERARRMRTQPKTSRRNSDFKPRKDKSLGILCDKFLAMFPLSLDDDCPSIEICLDKVANQLGIVKRRIYDIINILESLHMTSRIAKNRYKWNGDQNLRPVLSHLKKLAYQYGLDTKMQEIQEHQKLLQSKSATSNVLCSCGCSDSSNSVTSSLPFDSENFFHDERTLGIMCQKFIMLFLVTKEGNAINLDVATQMLVNATEKPSGNQSALNDGISPACSCQPRHKTKVRRLYDIANVLTSLGLIRKERYNMTPVRKPVFVYNGPNIDDAVTEYLDLNGSHTMRNSLLMVQLNEGKDPSNFHCSTLRLSRKRKEDTVCGPTAKMFCSPCDEFPKTKPVTRLGSLEDILRVAEQELKLLMSEESSEGTPSSSQEEFDLSQVKEEPQVKDEPLSDENSVSCPSSSFDSAGSFSDENDVQPDLSAVKAELLEENAETAVPADGMFLRTAENVLPDAETSFPTAESFLPATETILRVDETIPSIAETVRPTAEIISARDEAVSVVPTGSSVLPVAKITLPIAETPFSELKTDQMVSVKVVTGNSRDGTHTVPVQKMPPANCGSLAAVQSGNDQLALGKVKKFTVTRKLVPSHFVLQRDPANNLKLTLHHAPGGNGVIRLRPVASSPKLCLPMTCIKTLKTINLVKAKPATGIPRTFEIKKLVALNSGNIKGNISVVQ